MKTTGVYRNRLLVGTLIGLVAVYLILLIPTPESPSPPPGEADPFAWSRDQYWSYLESRFLEAREMDTAALSDSIRLGLGEAELLLSRCQTLSLAPSSPLLARLETAVFELSPLLAARPKRLREFMQIHNRLRTTLKLQSHHWDMNAVAARQQLYRLLYGTRTAIEEILLQAETGSVPALMPAADEPSQTPSADFMGIIVHSGDIFVSRGGAPTSALIARGNDYPGNFSHVALVHVDEKSHDISIVESHIERGVAVASVEEYLNDTKLRIMILRLRADHPEIKADPMLPHKAATMVLRRAQREHIPYDFEMNFRDDSKLFCSEVASAPYSHLNVSLWMGVSHISSPGVRSWLAAFGVRHFETQEPSDLEYDPQLTVVAEWRELETLYKDHLDNAVIDAMLEGAEAGDKLEYDWYMLPLGRLLKGYSAVKNLWGGVGPIPEGMSAAAALKNDHFSKRHDAIKKRLMQLAEDFQLKRGYRPPYWELVKLARLAKEQSSR